MKTALLFLLTFLVLTAAAEAGELHLSAAASLKDVMNELSDNFSKRNPKVHIFKNYGASGTLARQIEDGAPVDVFISANDPWVRYLQQKRMVADGIVDFAFNTLVFVGRPDLKVSSMKDLLKLERIAIGSPRCVPAGEYAMQAFESAYIQKQLEKKLVMAKDVRQCLTYADRGEVDGAIVYRTDALEAKRVKPLFTVPGKLHDPVSYPMALTASGARNSDARAFFSYLQGSEAKGILTRYGFLIRKP